MLFRLGSYSGPLYWMNRILDEEMQVKMYIWFIMQLADLNKLYSPGLSSSLPCKFQRKHSWVKASLKIAHSGGTGRRLNWEAWSFSAAHHLTGQEIQRGQWLAQGRRSSGSWAPSGAGGAAGGRLWCTCTASDRCGARHRVAGLLEEEEPGSVVPPAT